MLFHKTGAYLMLFILCFIREPASAQAYTISGTLQSQSGQAIGDAVVSLLQAKDSSWLQSALSNNSGYYELREVKTGHYIIQVQALGFAPQKQQIDVTTDLYKLNFIFLPVSTTLKEVKVTDQRTLIETAPGKLIVNVAQAASTAGSNALDLLRKAPGIKVSANGDISMQGKQGVLVLVDDRPTYLSGEELAQYLRSLSADQVAQLELISQASARYDAEGNAGIINIKIKRNRKPGLNGNLSSSYTVGRYPIYAETLSLNYNRDKLYLWTQAEYHYGKYFLQSDLQRSFKNNNTYVETANMKQQSFLWEKPTGLNFNVGIDYKLSENNNLGTVIKTNYNPVPYGSETDAVFNELSSGKRSFNHASFYADQLRKRAITSLYFQHRFEQKRELNLGADYLKYWMRSYPELENRDRDSAGNELPALVLQGVLPTNIDVYSARADYKGLHKKLSLEAGIKSSWVRSATAAWYELWQNNAWVYDSSRSNSFVYTEQIHAVYAAANRDFDKKWKLNGGLRVEQTNAVGKQSVLQQSFRRTYLSLFPTVFIQYQPDSEQQWEFSYGRRIQRPEYRSLNPFIKFVSKYVYDVGNPALQAQFSNYFEVKYSFRQKLFSTLSYNHINRSRQNIIVSDELSKVAYSRPENSGSNDQLSLSFYLHQSINNYWEISASGTGFYTWYSGILNGRRAQVAGTGYQLDIQQEWQFKKSWSADMQLSYTGLSQDAMIMRLGRWFWLEAGIGKKLLKDQLRIRLNVQDPFKMTYQYIQVQINELQSQTTLRYYTKQFRIYVGWYFGKRSDKKSKRDTGIRDEADRIK